jgi:hypothetical protein
MFLLDSWSGLFCLIQGQKPNMTTEVTPTDGASEFVYSTISNLPRRQLPIRAQHSRTLYHSATSLKLWRTLSTPFCLRKLHWNRRLRLLNDLRAHHEHHRLQYHLPNQQPNFSQIPLLQRHSCCKPSHCLPVVRPI